MEVIKKQRLAVCRILLDVVEGACEVRDPDLIMRTRHYPALQREMCFADRDWEEARDLSVLACLVLSKELHYKVKMMIGLVAHDLYSRESSVSYQQRLSFDVLMSAIDWPCCSGGRARMNSSVSTSPSFKKSNCLAIFLLIVLGTLSPYPFASRRAASIPPAIR